MHPLDEMIAPGLLFSAKDLAHHNNFSLASVVVWKQIQSLHYLLLEALLLCINKSASTSNRLGNSRDGSTLNILKVLIKSLPMISGLWYLAPGCSA